MDKIITNKGSFTISNESEEALRIIRSELRKASPDKDIIFNALSGSKYQLNL
jgi:hypothetical protein